MKNRPPVFLCWFAAVCGLCLGFCVFLFAPGVVEATPTATEMQDIMSPQSADDGAKEASGAAADDAAIEESEVGGGMPSEASRRLFSGLIGGKHDFTNGGAEGRGLCMPCHVPHLVDAPKPLFDRRIDAAKPLQPYKSPGVSLNGWSLLCLGCHDGVAARAVYSSPHATTVSFELAGGGFGAAGVRSHPVGVKYPLPTAAEKYNPASTVEAAGLPLPDGRIQCTTCHDAHNTAQLPGMIRITNERSRLCLTCHRL